MSMYKTIFWSETFEDYTAGEQFGTISGEVLIFGESAFASLDEAVASVSDSNAVIIKVQSGKYDSFSAVNFTVVNDGVPSELAPQVVAVNFSGADLTIGGEDLSVKPVALSFMSMLPSLPKMLRTFISVQAEQVQSQALPIPSSTAKASMKSPQTSKVCSRSLPLRPQTTLYFTFPMNIPVALKVMVQPSSAVTRVHTTMQPPMVRQTLQLLLKKQTLFPETPLTTTTKAIQNLLL